MAKYYIENGRFCTKIYIGSDSNGKPKYKKLKAESERALDKRVSEFRRSQACGANNIKCSTTLEKWIGGYLESLHQSVLCEDCSEAEYSQTKARLNYFLEYGNGALAKTSLDKLLQTDIQPAVNLLFIENPTTHKRTAKRTLRRYIRALGNVFEFARKMRAYSFSNPCDDVSIPKKAAENSRTAINEYTIKLILTTEHRAGLAAAIFLLAGLRRGELTALTWDDIDLETKSISISKSFDFKSGTVKEPKTAAGKREIAISDYLCRILKTQKAKSHGKYVVEKSRGGRITESAWKRLFESYMEALKEADKRAKGSGTAPKDDVFEAFTPHMLRHTYCSMLQWSGVDIKTAQELIGHNDYEVTANIYTHGSASLKETAAAMQNEFITHLIGKE